MIYFLFLLIVFIFPEKIYAQANQPIIYIDNEKIEYDNGQNPSVILLKGTTYADISFFAFKMDFENKMYLDDLNKKVISKDGISIEFFSNQKYATINGSRVPLPTPIITQNGRNYIPLRFVCDAVNYKIDVKHQGNVMHLYISKAEKFKSPVTEIQTDLGIAAEDAIENIKKISQELNLEFRVNGVTGLVQALYMIDGQLAFSVNKDLKDLNDAYIEIEKWYGNKQASYTAEYININQKVMDILKFYLPHEYKRMYTYIDDYYTENNIIKNRYVNINRGLDFLGRADGRAAHLEDDINNKIIVRIPPKTRPYMPTINKLHGVAATGKGHEQENIKKIMELFGEDVDEKRSHISENGGGVGYNPFPDQADGTFLYASSYVDSDCDIRLRLHVWYTPDYDGLGTETVAKKTNLYMKEILKFYLPNGYKKLYEILDQGYNWTLPQDGSHYLSKDLQHIIGSDNRVVQIIDSGYGYLYIEIGRKK